jgi:hypothetical protein
MEKQMTRRMKITKEVKDLLLEYQKLLNNNGRFSDRHDELFAFFKEEMLKDNITIMINARTQEFVILVTLSHTEARLIEQVEPEE